MHSPFISYIILLVIISFLVMLANKTRISYPIVLVVGGLLLSFIPVMPHVEIDPDMIFVIFLPPLLYEAAWNTSWKELWRWRRVITSFAFIIVIVTSCVVAVVAHSLIPGFTFALGFLLGGIVSPPDAVSATSIMRGIDVPRRVVSIVEGESLLNDASSLIVFRFALATIATGSFVFSEAAGSFFLVIIMGMVIGVAVAGVFFLIHRWLPTTPSIDIVLTFVTPYVMYIVAERLHFSGVLAVVSGGLLLSSQREKILSHASRLQGVNVWTTAGFVLNGLIFMLIGLQLPVIVQQLGNTSLVEAIGYGLLISAVLIVSRILCTYGASAFTVFISRFIKTADNRPGYKGPLILGWAGMRGVVSLAAALSIPPVLQNGAPFPQRNLILFITFTVILVTLVFQGLTLPALIRWVKMEDPDHVIPELESDHIIKKKMAKAGLERLTRVVAESDGETVHVRNLRRQLEDELKLTTEEASTEFLGVATQIIESQRELLHKLNAKAEFDEDIIRKHLMVLDQEETRLRTLHGGERN